MATKLLAGIAAVQIVRVAAFHRVNLPASASQISGACSQHFAAVAKWAEVPLLDTGAWRWRARSMSAGDADSAEAPRRMPSRLAQKQKLLDAAPAYPDDADAPIPKVSIGLLSGVLLIQTLRPRWSLLQEQVFGSAGLNAGLQLRLNWCRN